MLRFGFYLSYDSPWITELLGRLQSRWVSTMRTPLCLFASILLLGSACKRVSFPEGNWDGRSGSFKWRTGEVKLPPGFTYHPDRGADSFVGRFTHQTEVSSWSTTSALAKLQVRTHRERALEFNERIVEGARVWIAKKDHPLPNGGHTFLVAVTFPDCRCANFFVRSSKPEDAVTIDFIARSFQPSRRSNPDSGPLLCR